MGPTTFKQIFRQLLIFTIAFAWLILVTYGFGVLVICLHGLNPEIQKLDKLIIPAVILTWLGIFLKVMSWLDKFNKTAY